MISGLWTSLVPVRPRLPSITATTLTSLGKVRRFLVVLCICLAFLVPSFSIPQDSIFIAAQCWPFPGRDKSSARVQPKVLF